MPRYKKAHHLIFLPIISVSKYLPSAAAKRGRIVPQARYRSPSSCRWGANPAGMASRPGRSVNGRNSRCRGRGLKSLRSADDFLTIRSFGSHNNSESAAWEATNQRWRADPVTDQSERSKWSRDFVCFPCIFCSKKLQSPNNLPDVCKIMSGATTGEDELIREVVRTAAAADHHHPPRFINFPPAVSYCRAATISVPNVSDSLTASTAPRTDISGKSVLLTFKC